MSSCNYSNLPSVAELRAVRRRNEFRWLKMGKLLIPTASIAPALLFSWKMPEHLHLNAHHCPTIFPGKVSRLPWSFKPEQARGVCIFRINDEESGQIVWQIGIGHCDTKTKPKRLIISDVDGEHIKVISPKGFTALSTPFLHASPPFDDITQSARLYKLPSIF